MIEADRVMDDARKRKAPDVDDVLVAPTIVGGQLYTLAAEEKGIADALFVLGRALDRGRVSADVFVKVRVSGRCYDDMCINAATAN
jgi:ESCRT-I complex subunit TSG101